MSDEYYSVSRETIQQQDARVEALEAKLCLAEQNLKTFETLAMERAHQISALERECKQYGERVSGIEEVVREKDGKIKEMEGKLTAGTERLSALQVEKERLTQQVKP